jgi:hypothetical protein
MKRRFTKERRHRDAEGARGKPLLHHLLLFSQAGRTLSHFGLVFRKNVTSCVL